MNYFYVYIYLNPMNKGKYCYKDICFKYKPFYVGKGKNNRYKKLSGKRNYYFKNIITKIYNNNLKPIVVKLIDNLTEQKAFEFEKYYIKVIGRKDKINGPLFNLTDGGNGVSGSIINETTRKKLSILNSGKNNSMFNIHLYGKKNGMFGKHHSEKSKKLMSEMKKGNWIGVKNPKVKLNEDNVKIIYDILLSPITKELKISTREIGKIFNVSKSTIIDIKKRRSWKHLNLEEY